VTIAITIIGRTGSTVISGFSGGSLSLSGSLIKATINPGGSMSISGSTTGGGSGTATATGSPVPNAGPTTDFGINPYLNTLAAPSATAARASGSVNGANGKRRLHLIPDGSSNTILLGHMYIARSDYVVTTPANSSLLPIFVGGTLATARNGLGDTTATWLQDGTATTLNQWGSPMTEGGLMAMADASVRTIPYSVPLTAFLQPADGIPTPALD
jgi:hypothetical protein